MKRSVNAHLLLETAAAAARPADEEPAFSSYRFVRATRATAQKIVGETVIADELKDTEFTQADVKDFDRKKIMAKELDRVIEASADN